MAPSRGAGDERGRGAGDERLTDAGERELEDELHELGVHAVDPLAAPPVVLGPYFNAYLLGQCGHLLRVSLWWSGLSPLVLALTGRDSAIGVVRGAFNAGLLLFSPLGGAMAERVPMRSLLLYTTLARLALYSLLLPLCWFLLRSGLVDNLDSESAMFVVLTVICFLDGVQVAFANVVDVDMGGVDILGGQLGLPVDDKLRNRMNSVFQVVFDCAFLVFTPVCALLAWYVGVTAVDDKGRTPSEVDAERSGVLVASFALVFLITSAFSLALYSRLTRAGASSVAPGGGLYEPLAGGEGEGQQQQQQQRANELAKPPSLLTAMGDGARLCWVTKPVRYRLLFLGLEVAAEDAMVAVVIAEYAFTSRYFGDGSSTSMYLYTALIIAVGKVGAIVAGVYMHSCWKVPTRRAQYLPLFFSVLLASCSTLLIWLAFRLETAAPEHPSSATAWLSRGLLFLGVVLFFLFSTAPKIGLQTLLQGLASSVEGSGKVFGFVGPFVSILDALVVMGISLVFGAMKRDCPAEGQPGRQQCVSDGFSDSLAVTCAIYLAHGVLECLFGPSLIIPTNSEVLRNLGLTE
jgi:hypothetical protein